MLRVPAPFRSFAVRSEEASHAGRARGPLERVQLLPTAFLDAAARARLIALGLARMQVAAFGDIDYAEVSLAELQACTPGGPDLPSAIAAALQPTGVLGTELADYQAPVAARIDYLGAFGAGFHNDVARHWPRCLFWNLTLQADEIELVLPHAGLRLPLAPGDLMLFDPALAHGLCRPQDGGQALAASFVSGVDAPQVFLSGELLLSDAQWAALGSPWLPLAEHAARGALDLLVAEFDECSGAIQRLRALAQRMQPAQDPAHDAPPSL